MSKYYELVPIELGQYLTPDKVIEAVILTFDHYFFDEESAKKETAMRLQSLIDMGAPEELIKSYNNSSPIRCTLYHNDHKNSKSFSFDINVDQPLFIMPGCEEIAAIKMTDEVLKLSSACNYRITVEQD